MRTLFFQSRSAVRSLVGVTTNGPMRRSLQIACGLLGVWFMAAAAMAGPIVTFDQAVYVVRPGEAFNPEILIDGEVGLIGVQPVPNGLFSFGLQMTFPAADATANGVAVVPALNFFGFAAGASTVVGSGHIDAEGNIDQVGLLLPYTGSSLATAMLQNNAPVGSVYFLQLALHPHFPTEQLFLDGAGNVLDSTMVFGSARVVVIPEPSALCLAALGACAIMFRLRRVRRLR